MTLAMAVVSGCASSQPHSFDVVVYGGTAGGAIAAIAAANEGVSVALLEPRRHIGGMVSGGLGQTDFGKKEAVGGMSREYFEKLGKRYGEPIAWYFEPHVAEQVFMDWLAEAGVEVFFEHRLDSVTKKDGRIASIRLENKNVFTAKVFIDATYEGDLMARAGVSYTVGREGRDQYGESLAGRLEYSPKHQFDVDVSPYDDDGKLLPCVYAGDNIKPGQADKMVQAYNFRMCLCSRKENQVPMPKPADYDPRRYEIMRRYLAKRGKDLKLNDIMIVSPMPNDKTDINNRGPFSSDHIGASWEYPEASYQRRQEIWDDHISYVQGYFWFLANDPHVPKNLQEQMADWGLAKDEFADTNHWPHQMYVREARRMIGAYVMKESDCREDRTKPDSIGMGSYNIDSHNVQRFPTPDGAVLNEGDMQIGVQPYEVAYRSLTSKRSECENLLVPVCVSASHVAYSSIRMEPVYMILGHSSGVAAAQAVKSDVAVQDVDVKKLQERLGQQKQVLSMKTGVEIVTLKSLPGIVIDNRSAKLTGTWHDSHVTAPIVGIDYLHDDKDNKVPSAVRFVPDLPAAGKYEVLIAYPAHPNRAANVPVVIKTADSIKKITLDQRNKPTKDVFVSLGTFVFKAGNEGYVEISNAGTKGYVVADAVQWLAKGQ